MPHGPCLDLAKTSLAFCELGAEKESQTCLGGHPHSVQARDKVPYLMKTELTCPITPSHSLKHSSTRSSQEMCLIRRDSPFLEQAVGKMRGITGQVLFRSVGDARFHLLVVGSQCSRKKTRTSILEGLFSHGGSSALTHPLEGPIRD